MLAVAATLAFLRQAEALANSAGAHARRLQQIEHGSMDVGFGDMIMLNKSTGARALDGSPYGFYHRRSPGRSRQWTLYMPGGGWCFTLDDCAARSKTTLGSSNVYQSEHDFPKTKFVCGNVVTEGGGQDHDCNSLMLPYLDGASFAGYKEEPVAFNGVDLYFRGRKNFEETIRYAMEHLGLDEAEDLLIEADSAAGISALLHLDFVSQMLGTAKVRALVRGSFFVDYKSLQGGIHTFRAQLQALMRLHNMEDTLPQKCRDDSEASVDCLFPATLLNYVEAPTYMVNSKFDSWQLGSILQASCYSQLGEHPKCGKEEQDAVLKFGRYVMEKFENITAGKGYVWTQRGVDALVKAYATSVFDTPDAGSPLDASQTAEMLDLGLTISELLAVRWVAPAKANHHGGFMTSCITHTPGLTTLELGGKNILQQFSVWALNASHKTMHIDSRAPNGNGIMPTTAVDQDIESAGQGSESACLPFP